MIQLCYWWYDHSWGPYSNTRFPSDTLSTRLYIVFPRLNHKAGSFGLPSCVTGWKNHQRTRSLYVDVATCQADPLLEGCVPFIRRADTHCLCQLARKVFWWPARRSICHLKLVWGISSLSHVTTSCRDIIIFVWTWCCFNRDRGL